MAESPCDAFEGKREGESVPTVALLKKVAFRVRLAGQTAQGLSPRPGAGKDDDSIPAHHDQQFVAWVHAERFASFAGNDDLIP